MDRVVHALDYGEFESTHGGVRDYVFFIIFELAIGDVRSQAVASRRQTLSWCLNALHNLSVAVQQLHTAEITHNDIKPSNMLVFNDSLQKLADLGRATSNNRSGPWDDLPSCGDITYAAPGFWYQQNVFPNVAGKILFDVRQASDLYLLGSIGYFFVTGEALTPMLQTAIRPEHYPKSWGGSYSGVLPHLRSAFGSVMDNFDAELPRNADGNIWREARELRAAVTQLCDPDPTRRGHPINLSGNLARYSVERYVSLFDRISKSISILER